ncbi:MAG: D-tyrosyl-tRNA(Tyr) deacylase [Clostridia bacterium]|nr:D-tyrosyl-tRNA(Tyr) deacylase [Clostridia bacterium]
MRVVIQRVKQASVEVENKIVGKIDKGFLLLVGVEKGDTSAEAFSLAEKICKMRIFEDENGKMNLSLSDVDGEVLSVSQFTLCADCRRGNRPDYLNAAPPTEANELYELFNSEIRNKGFVVEKGIFGADMQVSLVNDGPVTIILDSKDLKKSRNEK